jgi:glutamate--cysteine ligase
LRAEIGGRSLRDIAAELIGVADAGLKARAAAFAFDADESHFLNALRDTVERGETLADELLRKYNGAWGGDLSRIYAEYSY